jgi:hypothetical protein
MFKTALAVGAALGFCSLGTAQAITVYNYDASPSLGPNRDLRVGQPYQFYIWYDPNRAFRSYDGPSTTTGVARETYREFVRFEYEYGAIPFIDVVKTAATPADCGQTGGLCQLFDITAQEPDKFYSYQFGLDIFYERIFYDAGGAVVGESINDYSIETSLGGRTLAASVTPVPVPAALPLFVAGLAGLGAVRRLRK